MNLTVSTDGHACISNHVQICWTTVTSWPSPSQDFLSPVACLDASAPTGLLAWYGAFAVILGFYSEKHSRKKMSGSWLNLIGNYSFFFVALKIVKACNSATCPFSSRETCGANSSWQSACLLAKPKTLLSPTRFHEKYIQEFFFPTLQVPGAGPTCIYGYSVEYPNFLAKKFIHIVYAMYMYHKMKKKYNLE